ncbi:MAG: sulfotransferase [Thiobacillaceae bacterium]
MPYKPNLFLIGAMKSGTTTLHEMLALHPEISMSEPKEPCYFVSPDLLKMLWPEMWRLGFWKNEASYLALFHAKMGARYYGESSTDYTKRPKIDGIAEKIATFNPDARFLYIMRDPIERTLSHYWHMVEHRGELRPPLEAILNEPHYTEVSHYADQLQPYIDNFGRERIHALTFEELKLDPLTAIQSVYAWLGVDSNFVPPTPTAAHNVTPDKIRQKRSGTGILNQLRHSALWDNIGEYCPAPIRQMGLAMVEKKIPRRKTDMSAVIARLRPLQQTQTRILEAQLGRTFNEWAMLWGSSR